MPANLTTIKDLLNLTNVNATPINLPKDFVRRGNLQVLVAGNNGGVKGLCQTLGTFHTFPELKCLFRV